MSPKVMRLAKEKVRGFREHMTRNLDAIENAEDLQGTEYQDSIIAVRSYKKEEDHTHTFILFPPNKEVRDEIIEKINHEAGITYTAPKEEKKDVQIPRRIVLHNRQAIGDILMFTCAVRDFKKTFPDVEIQIQSTVPHIWDHNPNISRESWPIIIDPLSFKKSEGKPSDAQMVEFNRKAVEQAVKEDKPVKLYIGPGKATNASNRSNDHFANAYRISMETILGIQIPQGPIRGDLYMTQEEYDRPPIIEPPYWLITAGEKGDWTCKTFAFWKWQEVVEKLPQIKFVQIGAKGHKHPQLSGNNVINFIGKTEDRHTGFRDLLNLFNYCEGSAGLVSFQMHLAAVFNKPCVTIAGAREPVWFTRYPGQQYLATDGCLPCTIGGKDQPTACWKCDVNGCKYISEHTDQKVPLCADLISSNDVVKAILNYYQGGRLSFEKPIGRSKLINVVKTPIMVQEKETNDKPFGIEWGGASITDKDWDYIKAILKEEGVKNILEFGSGLSTLLFNSIGLKVISYETRTEDIEKLKALGKDLDIRHWDGKGITLKESEKDSIDLVFVDGPGGGENREPSFVIAKEFKRVLVHDAGRPVEMKWQLKHLSDFVKVSQGGHRTAFWKHSSLQEELPLERCEAVSRPKMKVVFNGRGEGGAEGSTTWIMNECVKRGWDVEYISPNQSPSGTFRKSGDSKVNFYNDLSKISEDCDILFLYVNDWVWEFPKLGEVFSNLKAGYKVMAINFRLGAINTEKAKWTQGWNKYLFLNSSLEEEFKKRSASLVKTKVLAPPVDLSEYLKTEPYYHGNPLVVRHNSQGDTKYPKDFNDKLITLLYEFPDLNIRLMPAPTFLDKDLVETKRVISHLRNKPEVKEFLSLGNIFWYHLPEGYHDQGPKVILEAQASGLPVIADNHSGAKDRVVEGTGFLCNSFEEHVEAFRELVHNVELRREMGLKAKEHARKEYNMERWIEEIVK